MIKQYLVPIILFVLCLTMLIGSEESRGARAAFLGNTVFYPFTHSIHTMRSNEELKTELTKLREQLAGERLKNLQLQNELKLYDWAATVAMDEGLSDFETCEVIGYSGAFQMRNLIVNKGSLRGIKIESPVVSATGIVGKVVSVAPGHCVVMPFSNPDFQMPVMDKNTSVQGILQSDIHGPVSMNMIKIGSQISVGDTIVTSNLSQLYPKAYPVGTVQRIKESSDNLFISAELEPFTQVENLEHVFILRRRR
ncbi:MAG: rod shape-determining protein MreC [Candidatus Cloacimonadaceae bacterium]|jgi:rod shape-determining protein MreC